MDVWSSVAGTATLKFEKRGTGTNVQKLLSYTTPGQWQTLTYTYDNLLPALYDQVVIFMGFDSKATDIWYYDNVKGPGITFGGVVDATFSITDLGGTATSVEVALSNNPGTKIALTGAAGVGSVWTKALTGVAGSTITAPITYTVYVNGTQVPEVTGIVF